MYTQMYMCGVLSRWFHIYSKAKTCTHIPSEASLLVFLQVVYPHGSPYVRLMVWRWSSMTCVGHKEPHRLPRVTQSHFWHDITGCDLGGGATPKAPSVSLDWAEQEYEKREIRIYYREPFTVFVLLWESTDCVEQTRRTRIFIFEKQTTSAPRQK